MTIVTLFNSSFLTSFLSAVFILMIPYLGGWRLKAVSFRTGGVLLFFFFKFSVILLKVYLNFWICWDQFARQEKILSQLRQTRVARHSSAIYSALEQPEGWAQNSSSSVLLYFQHFSWPLPGKLLLSGTICSVWGFKVLLLKVGASG